MSIKLLTRLSHFITMLFGLALGMALSLLYQFKVQPIILNLVPIIVLFVILGIALRIFTIYSWEKNNYNLDFTISSSTNR